jgi:RNA polymerase sigma-70 factor (ECF subfamily)
MSNPRRYDEFVELLQRNTGTILAYTNALLLNWDDAEDVFQETCVVLWRKFDEFQPGSNFTAWALSIARNKAMDFQKSRSRRRAYFTPELQAVLMADVAQPEQPVADDGLDALSRCMALLDEGDRNMVRLSYGDGVRVRQLAARLGRSPQSVHNSLRRIRTALMECVRRTMNREDRP